MAKKKILYVEDELSLATMVKDTLEIGGYDYHIKMVLLLVKN